MQKRSLHTSIKNSNDRLERPKFPYITILTFITIIKERIITMRIITGTARGTKLETIESIATRPTSDKVKEAIFSMIQFEIEGRRVLDLFGGSGQLALEALSRGAAKATIIDESREAVNVIINNAKHAKLYDKCRISAISYSAFLKSFSEAEKFNLVFLDPPYGTDLMRDSLRLIAENDITAPGAYIICESDTKPSKKKNKEKKDPEKLSASVLEDVFCGDGDVMDKFILERSTVYGRTRVTVLMKK